MLSITKEELDNWSSFRKKINNTPLDEILIDGKSIKPENISDWNFTGLNNIDLLLSIDDIESYKSEIKFKVFEQFK